MAENGEQSGIVGWALANLGTIFGALRWLKPVVVVRGQAVVTRFADVEEVLARDWAFHVPYEEKMGKVTNGSNFFLGMQDTPTYTRDVSNMRLAVRRADVPERIAPFVAQTSETILDSVGGSCDIVQTLTRVVPTRLIGDYFGTPGWDESGFADAATAMFDYLFYPGDADGETVALAAAAQTRDHLDAAIAERKAARGTRDDVLERCLTMQDAGLPGMADVDIRNNLIGLLIGAIPTTSKCAAITLDYLFGHPDLLSDAQRAARENDDERLRKYVLECMRLSPFAAGVQRVCAEDYVLRRGSWRATRIPKGTTVLVATQSAMMDWRRIKSPRQFSLDRPDHNYLHFGTGLHTCFGEHINMVQIPGIVKAVLKRPGLRRTAPMISEGPFPVSLNVAFDAAG